MNKFVLILTASLGGLIFSAVWAAPKVKSTLHLESTSFKDGGMIPSLYACNGKNESPELNWKGAPPKTKSFALVVEDPDASIQTWIHWVIYNIPVKPAGISDNTYELLEAFPRVDKMDNGILQGSNDFKKVGYDGPCPPSGMHRYYFELYALDSTLSLSAGMPKDLLVKAMKGHILAKTQIMGLYGN